MIRSKYSLQLDSVICARCGATSRSEDDTCPFCGADREGAIFTSDRQALIEELPRAGWLVTMVRKNSLVYPSLREQEQGAPEPVVERRRVPVRMIAAGGIVVVGLGVGLMLHSNVRAPTQPPAFDRRAECGRIDCAGGAGAWRSRRRARDAAGCADWLAACGEIGWRGGVGTSGGERGEHAGVAWCGGSGATVDECRDEFAVGRCQSCDVERGSGAHRICCTDNPTRRLAPPPLTLRGSPLHRQAPARPLASLPRKPRRSLPPRPTLPLQRSLDLQTRCSSPVPRQARPLPLALLRGHRAELRYSGKSRPLRRAPLSQTPCRIRATRASLTAPARTVIPRTPRSTPPLRQARPLPHAPLPQTPRRSLATSASPISPARTASADTVQQPAPTASPTAPARTASADVVQPSALAVSPAAPSRTAASTQRPTVPTRTASDIRRSLASRDLAGARRQLQTVPASQQDSAEIQRLADRLTRLEGQRDAAIQRARNCAASKASTCVVRNANRALAIDARNPQALALLRHASSQPKPVPSAPPPKTYVCGRFAAEGHRTPASGRCPTQAAQFHVVRLGRPDGIERSRRGALSASPA